MAEADGRWDCTVDSPMGDQRFTVTVTTVGAGFTGVIEGALGRMNISDGKIAGDALAWSMAVTRPMPMTLGCTATIAGDVLTGKVSAGFLGSFPLRGTRIG